MFVVITFHWPFIQFQNNEKLSLWSWKRWPRALVFILWSFQDFDNTVSLNTSTTVFPVSQQPSSYVPIQFRDLCYAWNHIEKYVDARKTCMRLADLFINRIVELLIYWILLSSIEELLKTPRELFYSFFFKLLAASLSWYSSL